ncbi:MAG: GntR family transcriptional regulator [Lachnospiraceae bacterium]|nr:GntR family transcriptional regulator [Lachnospiraceae bacterium]
MKKLIRTNLTDQIASYIQNEIIKGNWKAGDKLPSETELSEILGVSRMSLRNAIQRCNAIGLTETRIGEGTFVRNFDLRSYFGELYQMNLLGKHPVEINELRCVLQIASLRLALFKGFDAEILNQLEHLFHQMETSAEADDMEAFHEADAQFHRTICSLCKNDPLYIIYDALEFIIDDITRQNVEHSVEKASDFSLVLGHHREIMESLRAKDIDSFIKAQFESLERSYRYYSEYRDSEK